MSWRLLVQWAAIPHKTYRGREQSTERFSGKLLVLQYKAFQIFRVVQSHLPQHVSTVLVIMLCTCSTRVTIQGISPLVGILGQSVLWAADCCPNSAIGLQPSKFNSRKFQRKAKREGKKNWNLGVNESKSSELSSQILIAIAVIAEVQTIMPIREQRASASSMLWVVRIT